MNRLSRVGFVLAALMVILGALAPPASAQIQIFSAGPYGTPETISLAPIGFGAFGGSYYFIPDFRKSNIWFVPTTGGPPTAFLADPVGPPLGGGLFLPPGWGADSGRFLVTEVAVGGQLLVYDGDANMAVFDPLQGAFTTPLIAPAQFAPHGGSLFVSDQFGYIWRADPAGGGLTLFKDLHADPSLDSPGGLEFTPSGFGSVGNRLMVSSLVGGNIAALAADGTGSIFTTVPLAA